MEELEAVTSPRDRPPHAPLRQHWLLDDAVVFLNHGSFGACPRAVLEYQTELRRLAERQPVQFFARSLAPLLEESLGVLADFVGASADRVVFVPNATTGVNTVLRSLRFRRGDELLTTDHAYAACRNALDWMARREGLTVKVVRVPLPVSSPDEVIAALVAEVGPRTRLAMIDHVTSPTGLVLPVEILVPELQRRGVLVLVDGAHGPGMVPLALDALGADFYTGNCHKWVCAPKGAALLYADPRHHQDLWPLSISHGGFAPGLDAAARMRAAFAWTGTSDPTAYLAVGRAIEVVAQLVDGGWPEVRRHNRELALRARRLLCDRLSCPALCPDSMIGSLAAVSLPHDPDSPDPAHPGQSVLNRELLARAGIEVPVFHWPEHPHRLLRISAHLHNGFAEYEYLAAWLTEVL
jgi:isopenicillin-N epimerase